MANSKKKIILNEILFWKQNKLLPDHYCDFLMTLYSEGNEIIPKEEIGHNKSIIAKEKRNNIIMLLMLTIVPIALLMALFMSTELVWVIAPVVGIIAIIFMILAYRFAKRNKLITPILHIGSALLLLGLSVKVSITYFQESQILLYILLILNSCLWLFTGLKFKLMYFTVSGALGIAVLVGYQVINF